jgi:hypothetical protein
MYPYGVNLCQFQLKLIPGVTVYLYLEWSEQKMAIHTCNYVLFIQQSTVVTGYSVAHVGW